MDFKIDLVHTSYPNLIKTNFTLGALMTWRSGHRGLRDRRSGFEPRQGVMFFRENTAMQLCKSTQNELLV
jgi:hypothetical protein